VGAAMTAMTPMTAMTVVTVPAARVGLAVRVTAGAGVAGLGHAHRRACPDGADDGGAAASSAEPATEPTRLGGQ